MPDHPLPVGDALDRLLGRVSVSGKALIAPGPDDAAIGRAVAAACRAPDHGNLKPWRFLVFRGAGQQELGRMRAEAMAAREPGATPEMLEQEAAKALRGPCVIAAAAVLRHGHKIPVWEQMAAASAATMNLLNAFHLMGFGAMWVSGKATEDTALRRRLGFAEGDALLGWVHVGTPDAPPAPRERPDPALFWRDWSAGVSPP
jgi:nitroreductase